MQLHPQQAFPLRQNTFEETIGSQETSFLITTFTDYVLVIVSQTGTIGTVLRARCAPPMDTGGLITNAAVCPLHPHVAELEAY